MGVKWLTSFVRNVERIVSSQVSFDVSTEEIPKQGQNPTFVVDAWAFLYHVWLTQFGDSMRGLDYGAFQLTVQKTIKAWESAGITTIFVFDGPFLPAKLPKIIERKAGVVASNAAYIQSSPTSRSSKRFQIECGVMAPLLLQALICAIDTMKSSQVEMVFAPTEADSLVAEIATEKEQGYAISLDSDFFILCARGKGCQYVPLDSLEYLVAVPVPEQPVNETLPSNGNGHADDDGFEQVGKRKKGSKRNQSNFSMLPALNTPTHETKSTPPLSNEEGKLSSVRMRAYRSHDLASHLQIPPTLLPLLAALVGNDYTTSLQSNVLFRNLQGPERINQAASILRGEWLRITNESKVATGTRRAPSKLQMTMSSNDAFDDSKSDTFSSPSSATATPTRNTPGPPRSSTATPLTTLTTQDPVRAMVQVIVEKSLNQEDAGYANPRYVPTGEKDLIVESIIDSIATYSLLTHSDAPHLASPSALFFGHPSSLVLTHTAEQISSPEAVEKYRQAYARGHFEPSLIEAMTQRIFIASHSSEDADVKSVQVLAARELRYWLWAILFEAWGMSWARDEWDEPSVVEDEDATDSLEAEDAKAKGFLSIDRGYKEGEKPDDVISVDTESSDNSDLVEDGSDMDDLPSRPGSVAELRKSIPKPAPGVVEYVRKGQLLVGELVQILPLLSLLNGDLIDEEMETKLELSPSLAQLRGQHEASRDRVNGNEPASDPVPPAVTLMSLGIRLDLYLHAHRSSTPAIQALDRNWWSIAAILRLSILHESGRLGPAKKKVNWSRGELIAAIQSACYHFYQGSGKEGKQEEQWQEAIRDILPSTRAIHLGSTVQLLLKTSTFVAQSLLLPIDVKEWPLPHLMYHGPTFHRKMSEAAMDAQSMEKNLKKQERAILDAVTLGIEDDLGIDVSELRRERKAKKKEAKSSIDVSKEDGANDQSRNRSNKKGSAAVRNNFALLGEAVE